MAKIIGADGKKIYVVRYWLFEDGWKAIWNVFHNVHNIF